MIRSLKRLVKPTATVLRDGAVASGLRRDRPGRCPRVAPGMTVAADARVIEAIG
jgi:hypothetical protein